jgi:glycosyltransferase involved in cell wall biosynthesis
MESLAPSRKISLAPLQTGSADGAPGPTDGATAAPSTGATEHPSPPLRLLMIVESAAAGTGRHVLDLAEGLIGRGCDVHLIYSTRRIDRLFVKRLTDLPALRRQALPMRTGIHPSDWRVVRAVRRYIRAAGPFDVIHGHSSKGGAVARLAALGSGAPAFYTLHGLITVDPSMSRWKRGIFLGIEWCLGLRTSRIVAVAPEEARAAVRWGLGRSRVVLIPNGIPPSQPTPRGEVRQALDLPAEAIVFGFVGRLVALKATDVLIQAFATIAGPIPQALLVIVGGGPLEASLKELARELGVAERVHWLGERDAAEVFPALDVFAMPSRKEGLPYVVLEAMAGGLPVVATVSAGVEILVESGGNGIVVPTDDVAALSQGMLLLGTDAALRERYGRASRRRAARFTVDAMVDRTLAVYRGDTTATLNYDAPPVAVNPSELEPEEVPA